MQIERHRTAQYLADAAFDARRSLPASSLAGASGAAETGEGMLSDIEAGYLSRIARGQTAEDIAAEDGIAVQLVQDALSAAETKLGAMNLMDAVTKAARLGLLKDDGSIP
jgi:DNA-binding CsgD family transcriptional regulator